MTTSVQSSAHDHISNEETFASELLEHLKEEMMLPAGLKPHTGVLSVIQI